MKREDHPAYWSEIEKNLARKMFRHGASVYQVARALKRDVEAVFLALDEKVLEDEK